MCSMNSRPSETELTETRKSQFSVGLPGRQFDKLTIIARSHGQSRSSYAAAVIEKHLNRQTDVEVA
jgi:predicted DNA-binding protein